MRTAGLVLFLASLLLLARFGQAQQYLAEDYGTKQKVVVPEVVVKAFHHSFPAMPEDSIIAWEHGVTPEGYTPVRHLYRVSFTQHGVRGNADFNEHGKLGDYKVEIATDSLPKPVLRTITRKLLWKNAKKQGYTLRAYAYGNRDFAKGDHTYKVYRYSIYIKGVDGMYVNDEWIYPNGKISKVVRFR